MKKRKGNSYYGRSNVAPGPIGNPPNVLSAPPACALSPATSSGSNSIPASIN